MECLEQESILQNTRAKAINMCMVLVVVRGVPNIKIDLATNVKGIWKLSNLYTLIREI